MTLVEFLHKSYIRDTQKDEKVVLKRVNICNVKKRLRKIINEKKACSGRAVYLSTKSLKHINDRHLFDKNVPEDLSLILNNLIVIIKYPDRLYSDLPEKRGDFLFVKEINKRIYWCSVEIWTVDKIDTIEIVSASLTGEKYLKKFTLLWSWGNG